MKTKSGLSFLVIALGVAIGAKSGYGQTTPTLTAEASQMDAMAASQGQTKVIDKISGDFNSFLGADAKAVVTGLQNGTSITLTTTTPGTTPGSQPTVTTTTINPPTGKMGFGNVFISLALAKQQLGQLGITQPTPEQLQAALLGGTMATGSGTTATTTNLQGILTMRSENMGWGQIAQKLGTKLGPVVSSLKSANHSLASQSSSPSGSGTVNAAGQTTGSAESGIVTGSGRAVGRSGREGIGKGAGGEGIISGSGRPVSGPSGITTGRGHGYGGSGGRGDGGRGKGN